MPSPAQQFRERAMARAMAGVADPALGTLPEGSPEELAYAAKLHQLGMDEEELRNIQSTEAKIAAKSDKYGDYADHVNGWLEGVRGGGVAVYDEIVLTMLIWAIDLARWMEALSIAETVLQHGLPMPERFKRTTACYVAEEIANTALKAFGTGGPGEFPLHVLENTEELTAPHDMPDQVRAKLKKALGLAKLAAAEKIAEGADGPAGEKPALIHAARADLIRALELDSAIGVKTMIKQIDGIIAKLAPAEIGAS